ncbi:MAG: plastocyanin/azurin family copper-binding protein [Dehalococcoidia bacterium]
MIRSIALIMGILAASLLTLVLPETATDAATQAVQVQDDQFSSDGITINAGDTVQWNWTGENQHSVISDTDLFASSVQTAGSFSFQFNSTGTYAYFCSVHGGPGGAGMSGTVTVQAAPTSTPQPSATPDEDETPSPTRTATPLATPAPTDTPLAGPAAVATSILETIPISAPVDAPGSAAAGASQLPSTGADPRTSPGAWLLVAALLGATGAIAITAAHASRRV